MISRPTFKSNLRVSCGPDHVLLESETGSSQLEGRIYSLLAPLLDGRRTIPEIYDSLEGQAELLLIHFGLSQLEAGGFIVEADDTVPLPHRIFRDTLNIEPAAFRSRLSGTRVSVHALGTQSKEPMDSILRSSGVSVSERRNNFSVVLVDDYLDDRLHSFNRSALTRSRPWMVAKPVGSVIWVGPIFLPGKTACWNCLAERLRQNRSPDSISLPQASFHASVQLGLDLAATEVWKWIVQHGNPQVEGRLLTWDVKTSELQHHAVTRLDHCTQCGSAIRGRSKPDRFEDKRFWRPMEATESYTQKPPWRISVITSATSRESFRM
jgi:ribosomal protein S12 methylthiotransferase accessory factor